MSVNRRVQALPNRWIMIDRRLGASAAAMVAAMPPRSGVIIRPYAMHPDARHRMMTAIVRAAKARRHLILWAAGRVPRCADGQHIGGPVRHADRFAAILTMAVHDQRQAAAARRQRPMAVLISPLFATASHPGAHHLGLRRAAMLAARSGQLAIALGGMDSVRFRCARRHGFAGWAAVDAWSARVKKGQPT